MGLMYLTIHFLIVLFCLIFNLKPVSLTLEWGMLGGAFFLQPVPLRCNGFLTTITNYQVSSLQSQVSILIMGANLYHQIIITNYHNSRHSFFCLKRRRCTQWGLLSRGLSLLNNLQNSITHAGAYYIVLAISY